MAQSASKLVGNGARHRGGFSLLDVLVSLAVIAFLISILLPALGSVTENARRVACQSNIRSLGTGVLTYSNDYEDWLPPSHFLSMQQVGFAPPRREPEEMITVRLQPFVEGLTPSRWDGLGFLHEFSYLDAPPVFYCPSHRGNYRFADYSRLWREEKGEIISNFHYRGEGPRGTTRLPNGSWPTTRRLTEIDPEQTSLIADGMRDRSDVNHRVGANYFRADLTVHWYDDSAMLLSSTLPEDKDSASATSVLQVWSLFDRASMSSEPR